MIGTLARKRTNVVALAVLAALVAALFAVIYTVSAAPSVTVNSDDSDDVVKVGTTVTLTGYVAEPVARTTYTGHSVQATGGSPLIVTQDTAFSTATVEVAQADGTAPATETALGTVYVPEGTPDGSYNVQILVRTGDTPPKYVTGQYTLEVRDPGDGVSTAELSFGYVNVTTDATTNGTLYQLGTEATGIAQDKDTANFVATATTGATNIVMVLNVKNEEGNQTNNRDVNNVTLIAQGGRLNATAGDFVPGNAIPAAATDGSVTITGANARTTFSVSSGAAGTVTVWAIVVGTDGSTATSERVPLTFTGVAGTAANPSVEDGGAVAQDGASIAAQDDGIDFTEAVAATRTILPVSATDANGLTATLEADTITAVTVKGPDDEDVTDNGITGVDVGRYALDSDGDATNGNQPGIIVALAADTAPGEYTVTAAIGTSTDEATFTVTGPPTNVDVSIDADGGTGLGAQITVTATVTDVNDVLVAPTDVTFEVGDGSPATFVGIDPKTKDGVASRNAVITGAGVITVIATANGVSGVAVIVAGEEADERDEAKAAAAGPVASIELEAPDEVASGDTLTVSATVADANGDAVADGTEVTFSATGDLSLTLSSQSGSTVNGAASVVYTVGDGYGTLTIVASSGGVIATIQVSNPEPEVEEVAPEPAPATLASASASASADTAGVGDSVDVTITATDSEGNTADNDLIAAVIVSANGTLVPAQAMGSQTVSVSCASSGDLNVSVTVVGKDGSRHEASASVTCLGDVASLTLGDPSGSLSQIGDDSVTIEVTGAADENGNAVDIPSDLEASVSGEGVSASVEGTTITVSSAGTAAAKVAAGDYTVTVSAGDVSAEATVTVDAEMGPPASISVSASVSEVSSGDLLTVTASVSDAGGDAVADGTSVTFTAGGSVTLSMISSTNTSDGDATAIYIVGAGEGTSTVYAVSGAASDSVSVSTPEPEVVEVEPAAASLDCFGNLVGFSTWTCGVDSTASEAFGLLADRGATAIHLWNGSAWVRYSVVDGSEVPGSSDFMIAEDDILYISN